MNSSLPPRIGLVALDLDGTLLDSRYQVPAANVAAVRDLLAAGIPVAPVTGRRYGMAADYADKLGLAGYMVFQNGAVIKELPGRHLVYAGVMDCGLAREAAARGRAAGFSPVLFCEPEGRGTVLLEDGIAQHQRLERYLLAGWSDVRLIPRFSALRRRDVVQVLFVGSVSEIRALDSLLGACFGGDVKRLITEYALRDLALLDLMAPEVSKGAALARVGALLGVAAAQTAALGDNFNDADMLSYAGWPMVMANSPEELKRRHPRRLLPPNDEAGVAWGVWRHLLRRPDRLREWFGGGWSANP